MGPMRASRTPGTTHTGHLCQLETWSWRPTREGHRTHDTVTDGLTKQATRRGASRLESPVRRPPHTPRLFSRWNTISGLWGPTTRETALLTPVAHTWLTVATRQARQSHTTHRVQHRAHSRSIWIVRALQAPGILRPRRPPSPRHAHGNLSNSVHTLTDASATQCTREAQITGDLFLKVVVGECTLLICCCTRPTRPLGPFTRSRLSATRPTQPHSRAHSPRRSEWPSSSQPRRARWRQRWCRCQPHCPRHRPASLQTP